MKTTVKTTLVAAMMSICLANVSYGQDPNWTVVSATHQSAESPDGVHDLLNRYKGLFENDRTEAIHALLAGNPVLQISAIELREEKLRWTGPTSCKKEDGRLISRRLHAKVTTHQTSGVRFQEPSEVDPCQK